MALRSRPAQACRRSEGLPLHASHPSVKYSGHLLGLRSGSQLAAISKSIKSVLHTALGLVHEQSKTGGSSGGQTPGGWTQRRSVLE